MYRSRATCMKCHKEVDSDYQQHHIKRIHGGDVTVKFIPIVDSNQTKLKFSPSSSKASVQRCDAASPKNPASCEDPAEQELRSGHQPSDSSEQLAPNPNFESANSVQTVHEIRSCAISNSDEVNVESPSASDEVTVLEKPVESQPPIQSELQPTTDEQSDSRSHHNRGDSNQPVDEIETLDKSQTKQLTSTYSSVLKHVPHTTVASELADGPNQPSLDVFKPQTFPGDKRSRDFKKEWYKAHPWISYDKQREHAVCFPCRRFMDDESFTFNNWKKSERLLKHSRSKSHQMAMTKWLLYKCTRKNDSSVLTLLDNSHQDMVRKNRDYLRVIIECLAFTAIQNIAQRGHVEDRRNIGEMAEANRGNFLELLHLRCKDIPWLKEKLSSQLSQHAQWISPTVQNEILEIIAKLVTAKITEEVKDSGNYSVIVDETSDISRLEQVAVCLRYVFEGSTKESFVGFHSTKSTEGLVLYDLLTSAVGELGLELKDIVGQCFDGAANMSGIRKGLATRMKECSPQVLYVHCYAHTLNLAMQDALSGTPILRNTLGVVNTLFNFIGGSTKRQALFKEVEVGSDEIGLNLKSLSQTRWTCRWEAVKAVIGQLPRIVKTLLKLANDRDPKTYVEAKGLLKSVCDFQFGFGLAMLKVVLSNTSALSAYLQGRTMDVITARRTADATAKALQVCRSEESFQLLWAKAADMGKTIRPLIEDSEFEYTDPQLPRQRRPSRRLQVLVGENTDSDAERASPTPEDFYRVEVCYSSLDKVMGEMSDRFQGNDNDVLCALGDIAMNKKPAEKSYETVKDHYGVDIDLLAAEKNIFLNFVQEHDAVEFGNVSELYKFMFDNSLSVILPTLSGLVKILAAIPATSCTAERSFSALRRLKTYLRNTMGQARLSNLAVLAIERKVANEVMSSDMDKIIDLFGLRGNRNKFFF